jgi:predicted HD phosphohydrolase
MIKMCWFWEKNPNFGVNDKFGEQFFLFKKSQGFCDAHVQVGAMIVLRPIFKVKMRGICCLHVWWCRHTCHVHWEKSWEKFSQNLYFSPKFGNFFLKWAIFFIIRRFQKKMIILRKKSNFGEKHKFWENFSQDFSQCTAVYTE